MEKSRSVSCPRCGASFTCNAGAIEQCQCRTVELSGQERSYVSERYDDCLCAACLEELKAASVNAFPEN